MIMRENTGYCSNKKSGKNKTKKAFKYVTDLYIRRILFQMEGSEEIRCRILDAAYKFYNFLPFTWAPQYSSARGIKINALNPYLQVWNNFQMLKILHNRKLITNVTIINSLNLH